MYGWVGQILRVKPDQRNSEKEALDRWSKNI